MFGGAPVTAVLLVALAAAALDGEPASAEDGKTRNEGLLALHTADAASYAIYRDSARTEKLELRREPIYRWTNPTRVGGQVGDVFIWTYRGRPEVVASIFSHPHNVGRQRVLCHELHSLSEAVLIVDRQAKEQWVPRAPGVELKAIAGSPAPAATAPQRLVQLRALARDFSGRSLSDRGQAWELRLLPQPLHRYESPDLGAIDGAVFALVSSAGTDPEIILVIEARKTPEGAKWVYGAARFSDMNLWLKHKDQEVWSSIRSATNTFAYDATHRFRFYQDRIIPELDPARPVTGDGPRTEGK